MSSPSLVKHPRLLKRVLQHPRIFALGWREAHSDIGMTYDNDPSSARSEAYDVGRDLRKWGKA